MPKKLTTEEFISKAKNKHGDRYDYSKVNYKNNKTKVEVICRLHGSFWQKPDNHLDGKGCPSCGGNKKLTTESFIERVKSKYGDRYDYSKVKYKNNYTKVEIICPEHGSFWQKPDSHLRGSGCPVCFGTKKLTIEEFIERANKKHGDRYDYSKAYYKNAHTKVEITCRFHGSFWQRPSEHLSGAGCLACSGTNKLTTEEFIVRANKKHGGRYDYSKVNYRNSYTKVEIICKIHGSFWQKPSGHLNGQGCPSCSGNKRLTTESFIERAKSKHVGRYDYSKVNYKNSLTKVEIICKEHGSFWQRPSVHLRGAGCPACGDHKKLNTESFIERSKGKHGSRYDYSKVDYKHIYIKVEIICKEHGSFWQRPRDHLRGAGCLACGGSTKLNTDQFIEKSKSKHGYKYDYSRVKYKNNVTKVEIICKIHGSFWQVPMSHLQGHACPVCAGKVTQTAMIFRKLAIISEIEPFTYQFIQEFTGLSYSHVIQLCIKHGVKIYKNVLIKETSLYNSIEDILSKLGVKCEVTRNARILKPNNKLNNFKANGEIDIYIPELNLGFEFNGMWCHKEGENGMKHRGYHMDKYNTAKSQGITLYHIWEDEYSCEEDIEMWNKEIEEIIYAKNRHNSK